MPFAAFSEPEDDSIVLGKGQGGAPMAKSAASVQPKINAFIFSRLRDGPRGDSLLA
ncbi:hypothetical protein [Sphingobium sp. 15-1]|uniref:hypothetical protein n=1 Tax=Sphingobium sp. 15-1 TaxID=2729616 RepID=UPI001C3F9351|nr:hypothetical protein [Sphingobium sp. 15-1]